MAAWSAGTQTYGSKATVCVSDPMFGELSRQLVLRFSNKYSTARQAGLRSLEVSMADFVDFGHLKCDVYVVGSYEELYNDPYTQDRLVGYVANGKALMVVGPDVMPSIFYAPDAPSAMSRRMLWEGNDKAGDDGRLAAAVGAVSLWGNQQQQQQQQWMVISPRRLAAGDVVSGDGVSGDGASGGAGGITRRALSDVNSLPINQVIRRMQMLISGVISDPGGSLALRGSKTGNAVIAAQQYTNYLRDPTLIVQKDYASVVRTVENARTIVTDEYRGTPGTELLYQLLDKIKSLQKEGYALPPQQTLSPPSAAPLAPPPPRMRKRPPPPPPPDNLELGVKYLGCYADNSDGAAFPIPLVTDESDNRETITVNGCLGVAMASPVNATAGFFVAMQKSFTCFGSYDPPLSILSSNKLPDTSCPPCVADKGQRCGDIARTAVYWMYEV
ncbi:hypothetical protein PLESTM_002053100 [Pleodorina starrii]|nr:hypothetical protein PLESTM_002053100 [Pleodorina starrii]